MYLLTSMAVVTRTCFDHIDRHVGQSARREYSYNLQRMAKLSRPQNQNQEICGQGKKLKLATNSKREETKIQTRSNQCQFYATTVTCNLYIYHHHVLTCNMQNMHQARYLQYNCHVSINRECEYTA